MKLKSTGQLLLGLFVVLFVLACGGAVASNSAAGGAPSVSRGSSGAGSTFAGKSLQGAPVAPNPATVDTSGGAIADVVPPIGEGPKVIRTARVAVEVRNGSFDGTVDKIFKIASDLGGYISGSDASADTGALRTGSVTFQVPSDRFTDAVAEVRGLGTIQNLVIGGQDVSAQYVDLQARLANEEAQRDAMLALLARAQNINDIITIQNQLGNITGQIEQLKGQIGYLDHSTSYSTVSVSVHEAAVAAKPAVDNYGFTGAFASGLHGFANTLDYMLVGLGYSGPVLILLGLGYGAWRLRRRFAPAV